MPKKRTLHKLQRADQHVWYQSMIECLCNDWMGLNQVVSKRCCSDLTTHRHSKRRSRSQYVSNHKSQIINLFVSRIRRCKSRETKYNVSAPEIVLSFSVVLQYRDRHPEAPRHLG